MKTNRLVQALRQYFTLGVIIGNLPNNILNGQSIDAVPLMADLAFIISQVNANAAPAASVPSFTAITAFTPTLTFGGGSAGMAYVIQAGAYVKIGSIVFFTLDIFLSAKGGSVGTAVIGGLPFAVSASFPVGSAPTVAVQNRNITYPSGNLSALISGTSLSLYNVVSAATWNVLDNTYFSNTSEILITGFYST